MVSILTYDHQVKGLEPLLKLTLELQLITMREKYHTHGNFYC